MVSFLNYKGGSEKLINEYKDFIGSFVEERTKKEHSQEGSDKEQANWIDYPELKKKVIEGSEQYLDKKNAFTAFRNFMLVALFTLQPPVRLGNYLDMKIKKGKKKSFKSYPKKNNYVFDTGNGYTFVFNNYKTAKTSGQIILEVQDPVLISILDSNALESGSKKLLGKLLRANSFRHIFITHFLGTNPSIEEKTKILGIMGQSYRPSQGEKYARVDQSDEESEVVDI